MNEKALNDLLCLALRRGQLSFELADPVVDSFLERSVGQVPDAAVERAAMRLQVRLQDAAIERARQDVHGQSLPFGRFIEAIREGACLTRTQICWRLRTSEERIQRFERGDLSPIALPPNECADILELFNVKLASVPKMIIASITVSDTKKTYRAAARSHGGLRHDVRSDDVERAVDAFARKMRTRSIQGAAVPAEVKAYVAALQEELAKRGRLDLLE